MNQWWRGIPNASNAASIIDSDKVGCAWIAYAKSSIVVSSCFAITSSAINSVASLPIIWAPNNSPYCLSKINFTKPSIFPNASALPLDWKEAFPIKILWPFWMASCSVNPTEATCGSQYVQPGIRFLSIFFAFLPKIFPTTEAAWAEARWASHGDPETSPMA